MTSNCPVRSHMKSTASAIVISVCFGASAAFAEGVAGDAVPGQLPNGKISITKVAPPVTRVFDYSGDFWDRATVLGDFGGVRTDLYEKGFSLDATYTAVLQSVTAGGRSRDDLFLAGDDNGRTADSGLLELNAYVDTAKAGWWSGGLFIFTVMSSNGDPLTGEPGGVAPVNGTAMWPVPFDQKTQVVEYHLMQALPNDYLVILGRADATNYLDRNSYANNPESQFFNIAIDNNVLWGEFLTFSTHAGLVTKKINDVTLAFAAFDPDTQPDDVGGTWENYGLALAVIWDYEINGLKGVFNPVVGYTSKDAVAFDNPYLGLDLIVGISPEFKDDNWMIGVTGEQTLWTPPGSATSRADGGTKENYFVPTQDFVSNAPGVGLFYRFAFTPEDRNPYNIYASGGIGARGVISGRPFDRMGLGVYTLQESGDLKDEPLINQLVDDEIGVEAFYNFAITPAIQLSGSAQYVDQGIAGKDDAWILGTRLFLRF